VVSALVSRSGREIRPTHRHGMTHSLYIQDPNARGVELVYELPREVWEGDIDAALNFAEARSREEIELLVDLLLDTARSLLLISPGQ
jgi:catechol-2,3-dioxygenase